MFVLRPSRLTDLPAIERIAAKSPVGVTSLPDNRERLYAKIEASVKSFESDVCGNGEETYFLVLEDTRTGELVGTSGVVASAGYQEPFYNYRNETLIHASRELGVHSKIHVLSLCHDLTGNTLLTSFYIDEPYQYTEWSDLLSRARLLLIAGHPQRFGDSVVSEMVGLSDEQGNSPFWDGVGRLFFDIDYAQAELYCGIKGRSFIAELLPQHPIYVPLLPEPAQEAIGQVHPAAMLPFEILINEGFETERYIDIFDGGCVVQARTANIRTIAGHRRCRVEIGETAGAPVQLLANRKLTDYRATVGAAVVDEQQGTVRLSQTLADVLCVVAGDALLVCAL
ncbi:arginine N-succinyltransferase [Chitinivorax tropicus]|uniref:Arginine N-succinyltransferase n=1 Tax=Chitinivorax tropicus TaxID=714531 RepID=A0A840MLE0_9PROT|nr:arginine/ornithine succinyltransferase subunit alpha [Chitinivorax tropicus]MBB5016993.1 arginine N-succinyltransferase [Chitinivorax tropicus]